jgi:hypothetical protein
LGRRAKYLRKNRKLDGLSKKPAAK